MSPVKEPGFFAPNLAETRQIYWVKDEQHYRALFDAAQEHDLLGEASAFYLRAPEAPFLIQKSVPDAKIVVCLREPADRAFSHYLMHKRAGYVTESIEAHLDDYEAEPQKDPRFKCAIIDAGCYGTQLKRYFDVFGRGNVKLVWFDELKSNPVLVVNEILRFLGSSALVEQQVVEVQHNPYMAPRDGWASTLLHDRTLRKIAKRIVPLRWKWRVIRLFSKSAPKPDLEEETRLRLKRIYEDEIHLLSTMVEVPPEWGYST